MNLGRSAAISLGRQLHSKVSKDQGVEVWVAPPNLYLADLQPIFSHGSLRLGAQNVFRDPFGAFTGEVSPGMLAEFGCHFAIVGHSERRHIFGESSSIVIERARGALESGLHCVYCIGETLSQFEEGATKYELERDLLLLREVRSIASKLIIAYEPVWAIGSGRVATDEIITDIHAFIADISSQIVGQKIPILYGGSVNPDNFQGILALPNVSGGLIGGAALDVEKFSALVALAGNAHDTA